MDNPQTGEKLNHRISPTGVEAEPYARLPSPGVQSLGGGGSRALGFAGQRGLTTGAPQDQGNRPPPLEGVHRCSGQKPRLHRNLSQAHLLVLEGLLGGGGGWPGNVCYPCKAGSSFGLLDVLWAPVDAPLWAQTQSRDHAVTSRVHNQEGMQDVCSAQRPVNTYATHVYLHKCRVTGLLQRGKGESAET